MKTRRELLGLLGAAPLAALPTTGQRENEKSKIRLIASVMLSSQGAGPCVVVYLQRRLPAQAQPIDCGSQIHLGRCTFNVTDIRVFTDDVVAIADRGSSLFWGACESRSDWVLRRQMLEQLGFVEFTRTYPSP